MESRIRKRAVSYGIIAILLAVVATTFVYHFSFFFSETEMPLPPTPTSPSTLLTTFESNEALRDFLAANSGNTGPFPFYGPEDFRWLSARGPGILPEGHALQLNLPGLATDYSTTNIQVAGVDEADIVKTDGQYIYLVSGNSLLIFKAYPPDSSELVSKMTFEDLYPAGVFVKGNRMVVLGSKYPTSTYNYPYPYYIVDVKTSARIYNITDRENPVVLRDDMFTGSYFNSRMIDDYVYFIVSQPAYIIYDTVILPKIYSNDRLVRKIAPSEIYYYNSSDDYHQYTTFVSMNIQNETEQPTYMTLMLGSTSSMYVSHKNMYVTFPDFNGNTTICRVQLDGSNMTTEAKGEVNGNVLNQFSMDEHNGYFRIATASWSDGVPRSNLFILNMDLQTVGRIVDIEIGENLDSARFMEDRCYLSTSIVKRDPFFVIDVTNATAPEILGYLKIPGFNRYLHPYDANHVIGLGRDETDNVKISFFDVTNVSTPRLMSEYRFEGGWSNTEALRDHHAFLFTHSKNLLAIPVSVNEYTHDKQTVAQGLFVFTITLTDGLAMKGNITHQDVEIDPWDRTYYVKRGLYIEEVLYTISDKKLKLNGLKDLKPLKEIPLP